MCCFSPEAVLQIDRPPNAVGGFSLVACVPFRVQVQVHVFSARLVVVQYAKVVPRLVVVSPELEAETVLSTDAHVQRAQLFVKEIVLTAVWSTFLLILKGRVIKGIFIGSFRVLERNWSVN